ncbi:MAG TPA: hypothetical protein VFU05_05610 [Cyclobacteriaceae bacterium]|nr:hypothetical protein [Cyclobacteriaceae bacterium]
MNTLRTLTIVFNLFIIIGAGHGIAPLGLFEVMSLTNLFSGDFQFNISGRYDERLMTVGLISVLGQSILISSYFFDKEVKSKLTIIGCFILFAATFLLTKDALNIHSIDILSLFTALPFIGTGVVLLIREIKGPKNKIEPGGQRASR